MCVVHAGVKEGWRLAWQLMVKELAPQDKSGTYVRQSYAFTSKIGDPGLPVGYQLPQPSQKLPGPAGRLLVAPAIKTTTQACRWVV